ncbi:MAG: ribokinase [Aureliella sp.]
MEVQKPRIAVLGSINMDLVARCAALPLPGQTLIAKSFSEIPGGKGANQAVAASRSGGGVSMIGRIGDDGFANHLRDNLLNNEIDCSHVVPCSNTPSGAAMIAVADSGENQIVVVPGANALLSPSDVHHSADVIERADILLLQLEIPTESVLEAITVARDANTKVVLDPAPAPDQIPDAMLDVDLICPNITEAQTLTGLELNSQDQIEAAARQLHNRGAKIVVVTLGDSGAALFDGRAFSIVNAYPTQAVDTTAAGDAFAGAMAVRWAESDNLFEAIRFGNAAGSLSASRPGAQPSLAAKSEILDLIKQNN